jgi:glycosyltransferase involved in cell wall biosynthesis
MIRLHILGIPYTITNDEYSHDAFTGKVQRFGPMMRSRGYEVYHYGVEGSEPNATKDIQLLTKKEWNELRIKTFMFLDSTLTREQAEKKNQDKTYLINGLSNFNSPLSVEFNKRLRVKLMEHYRGTSTDIVCCPLGHTHHDAIKDSPMICVENGIGYQNSYLNYRIFESQSILSCEKSNPNNYFFVIPNYYNIDDFDYSNVYQRMRIGFFGRLEKVKGLCVVSELAKRYPHVEFIICGQGDPKPFLQSPNIIYKPPIHGKDRSNFLGSCDAILCPSEYVEPFCGVSVEAQLCGTPVISTDYGAFADNIEQFKTGLRCHTLADYGYGIQMALDSRFDRKYIRERAVNKFDMYNLAVNYDYTFKSILDVHTPGTNGWYSKKSHMGMFQPSRIYLIICYYGAFPNYFQLYLNSLGENKIITVILVTDIDLTSYELPTNLIHVNMPISQVKQRAHSFLKKEYPDKNINADDLITINYKLVDFKIIFPLLFREFIPATPNDFVGWGDCDLIYGDLSNFIKIEENYDIIGGFHGHFTAIKNNEDFKYLFKNIPDYFELCTDNSRTFITDEIAYREPLVEYIKTNNLKMCFLNASMCDIVPPCFYHMFRKDEHVKNFFNNRHPTKNIKHVFYNKKLITYYDDGTHEESSYCHLQKRKMDMYLTNHTEYYINESTFTQIPLTIFYSHTNDSNKIKKIQNDNPLFTVDVYDVIRSRQFIEQYFPDVLYAYDHLIPDTYKCELFSYCVLYYYGGIYLHDIKMNTPLINFIHKDYFINDGNSSIFNRFMCSNKNPMFKDCIDNIVSNVMNKNYGCSSLEITGQRLLGYNYYKQNEEIKDFYHSNWQLIHKNEIVATCESIYDNSLELWNEKKIFSNVDHTFTYSSPKDIIFISAHYPKVYFSEQTKKSIEKYTKIHRYGFYYEEEEPLEKEIHQLHYYRSYIIQKCAKLYPNAKWFIWLDSDVYIKNYYMKIEEHVNLNADMLYHLFHEYPWGCYAINTGVKIIHRNALKYEEEIWSLRNTAPWNQFPFEQKTTYEYILPKIVGKYMIHDPYVLNCITKAYPDKLNDALFHHMCNMSEQERNKIMSRMDPHIDNQTYDTNVKIIIYIHVCQKGDWKRSFKMIIDKIKESGLYDECSEIRCGVLNDNCLDTDPILIDKKINIFYLGSTDNYERPTLLHMKNANDNAKYLYCHTKGLRWFGTKQEPNIVDWIKLLLYWNIVKWKNAVKALDDYDVYGCNYTNKPVPHYSGNFFWITRKHLDYLDNHIGNDYNDPEFWILTNPCRKFISYTSTLANIERDHYDYTYPEELYNTM